MMQFFNLFQKVSSDQIQKTAVGGCLTFTTFGLIIVLVVFQLWDSQNIVVSSIVDTSNLDERVRVNLNVTFHNVSCSAISLDQQDVTGAHLEDISHTIHKIRLFDGRYMNPKQALEIKEYEEYLHYPRLYRSIKKQSEINDCYGAQLFDEEKCITCQDVMMAYLARGWPQPNRQTIGQCNYSYILSQGRLLAEINESEISWSHSQIIRKYCNQSLIVQIGQETIEFAEKQCKINYTIINKNPLIIQVQNKSIDLSTRPRILSESYGQERRGPQIFNYQDLAEIAMTNGEGCQLYGHFYIRKVPGNFHFGFHGKGQIAAFLGQELDMTHTIHLLEFTPDKEINTLGLFVKTTNILDGSQTVQLPQNDIDYHLKLVESQYTSMFEEAYIYTFTGLKQITAQREPMPLVMFRYEFDAITMQYKTKIQSFYSLLITILGIIGGVFSLSKYISSILLH